jgi:hypothetical protein
MSRSLKDERNNRRRNILKVASQIRIPFRYTTKEQEESLGIVTAHREGRTAELPLIGARHNLYAGSVRQVCEALGVDWSDLPGPKSCV